MQQSPTKVDDLTDCTGFGASFTSKTQALEIVHSAIPGRARIAAAGLRGDPWFAKVLVAAISRDPEVVSVSASVTTGRLLVDFTASLEHEVLLLRLAPLYTKSLGQLEAAETEEREGSYHNAFAIASKEPADGAETPWHAMRADEVLGAFACREQQGLTQEAAQEALQRYGANRLATAPPRSALSILLDQVTTLPVGLLVGSAAFSVLTGGLLDAAAILAVVALNATIGFVTENQAERTISSLGRIVQPNVQVVRDGIIQHRPLHEVVPGDILALAPGMLVPADARILTERYLTVDESLLTGESLPVSKTAATTFPAATAQVDRRNMLYRGTAVTGGEGRAIVVVTGSRTEIGRIQAMVGAARPPTTPLQRQLDEAGRRLGYLSLVLCGGMVALGLWRGYGLATMLRSSISLAVAALPEGLPTVATVTLALGIRDMRRRNVIVRRLNAVETLGSVHTLCFDKTGTLTLNYMRATRVCLAQGSFSASDAGASELAAAKPTVDHVTFQDLLKVCVLCSDAQVRKRPPETSDLRGSATEIALMQLAIDHGIDPEELRASHPLIDVHYRSEQRKYMATRHRWSGGAELLAVKGSPEEVLAMSSDVAFAGETVVLDDERRALITAENKRMGRAGLRVLGFAIARSDSNPAREMATARLTWLGLVGLTDPVRPEMTGLIESFHQAGLRTAMITGDQLATAYNVAESLRLSGRKSIEILEGMALEKLDPELLSALARKTDVFGRVSPANKLQIVQALQSAREVVGMTGDGVNDSPALRAADIGIAMGSGSDAAHEVADVILQDDKLETMLVAIANGRSIYANIRKAVMFLLSTNLSEIMLMLSSTAFRFGQPLSPAQLLWINIATDVFPGLALGLDPPERDVLELPPRDPDTQVIEGKDLLRIGGEGGLITLAALLSHLVGLRRSGMSGATSGLGFTTLTVAQLLHALSCRSERHSIFSSTRRPPNPHLRWSLTGLLGLQLAITSLPFTRRMFGLDGLRFSETAIAAALGAMPLLLIEGAKAVSFDKEPRVTQEKEPKDGR